MTIPLCLGAGLDYGQLYSPNTRNLPGTRLAGIMLGLRGGVAPKDGQFGGVSYNMFIGWPLYKPEGFGNSKPTTGLQLTYQY